MKASISKKKMFFIGGISILAFVVFDGTPYGYAFTDKMFYKFYEVFIQNRLFCIKAIEKYNDAFLEYSIQGDVDNFWQQKQETRYRSNASLAAEARSEAAEKVYKRMCLLY